MCYCKKTKTKQKTVKQKANKKTKQNKKKQSIRNIGYEKCKKCVVIVSVARSIVRSVSSVSNVSIGYHM